MSILFLYKSNDNIYNEQYLNIVRKDILQTLLRKIFVFPFKNKGYLKKMKQPLYIQRIDLFFILQ